jgi:ammonia channel protein AmtB
VTGLVVITPASGFVDQTAAFVMGAIATPVVYLGLQVCACRRNRADSSRFLEDWDSWSISDNPHMPWVT